MSLGVNAAARKVVRSPQEMGLESSGGVQQQGKNSDVAKIGNKLNGSENTNPSDSGNSEMGPNVPPVNPENEPSMMEKITGAVGKAINGLGNMFGIKKPEETEGLPTQMANATQQQNGAKMPQEDSAAIQAKNGVGNNNVVANASEAGNKEAGTGSGENPEEKLGQIADVAGALGSNAPTETKELAANVQEQALEEKKKYM